MKSLCQSKQDRTKLQTNGTAAHDRNARMCYPFFQCFKICIFFRSIRTKALWFHLKGCGEYSLASYADKISGKLNKVVWSLLFCFLLMNISPDLSGKSFSSGPRFAAWLVVLSLSLAVLVRVLVSGTVRGGKMQRVKPLCGHDVLFPFSECDPILEKGLSNLLFTWQCLTRNIILTELILENSCACKVAHC